MSGSDFLLDTNILIYLGNGEKVIAEFLQGKRLAISFISEMELLSKPGLNPQQITLLQSMLHEFTVIELTRDIKSEAIRLRRSFKLKLPDAIIAATAIKMKTPLLTADKDFHKVSDIEIIQVSL